jgi:hypothetical protein
MDSKSATLCLALFVSLVPSQAADRFQLRERTEVVPEAGTLKCSVLTCDPWELSFLCPAGWAVNLDAPTKKVTFRADDHSATITMQICPDKPALRGSNSSEELRRHVTEKFPGARIAEAFTCHTGNLNGQAFDLHEKVSDQVFACYRVAWVPFAGGSMEFTLVSFATSAAQARKTFDSFISTFNVVPIPGSTALPK